MNAFDRVACAWVCGTLLVNKLPERGGELLERGGEGLNAGADMWSDQRCMPEGRHRFS